LFYAPNSKDVLVIDVEALGDFIQELTDRALEASAAAEMYEALKVAAKAELYDSHTGIIDADVLEIVQDVARAAIAKATSAPQPRAPKATGDEALEDHS
jgi:hypothetical protein